MFTRITTKDNQHLVINISQIVYIEGNAITLSTDDDFVLTDASRLELYENIFGDGKIVNPKASVKIETLLNELHKLLGGRGEAKPTTDRVARLKTRLKDFTEEELKLAAVNCGQDEFMQGVNDNNKRYATIDYLIRTSANVNKWLEAEPKKKKGMF